MGSVLRDWPPEALHLSFHSAGFDVFIQAQQNKLLLIIEYPFGERVTSPMPISQSGHTPSTANYLKIKPVNPNDGRYFILRF